MHLFIDTNIFLAFFHLSSDELEELWKLTVLLEQNQVVLHLPTQVRDEFSRNRDRKIADALHRIREQKLPSQFPQMCKDYPEFRELRISLEDCNARLGLLVKRLEVDIASRELKADRAIGELFRYGAVIEVSPEIIRAAFQRTHVGNPPGKPGSMGDAINWESLLAGVPAHQDLYFISDDRDYASALDSDQFDSFLTEEWAARKSSNIRFYRRLSLFFKEHFPNIKLAADLERDLQIRDLKASDSFARSRFILQRLTGPADFSRAQVQAFVDACLRNTQVLWIADDHDIREIINSITGEREAEIEPEDWHKLQRALEGKSHLLAFDEDDDKMPF